MIRLISIPGRRIAIASAMHAIFAIAGILSVYLGYRLFCASSYYGRPTTTRLIAGAVLALAGVALVVMDAESLRVASAARHVVRNHPAERGVLSIPSARRSPYARWV